MISKPSSLWRHPAFITLLTAQTISLIGSEVSELALPLTAVLVLNANPAQMGILRALEYAPVALFGLFAGVWIDRIRRRPVLIVTDLGRGLLLSATGFLAGILSALFSPLRSLHTVPAVDESAGVIA